MFLRIGPFGRPRISSEIKKAKGHIPMNFIVNMIKWSRNFQLGFLAVIGRGFIHAYTPANFA